MKKIVFISILVLVISSSVTFGANATSFTINRNQKLESISSTSSNSILTIEKKVNQTVAQVNDSIIVQLILTNVGSNPIYNINLTEPVPQNPNIITKNLFTPLTFAKFDPNQERIISYSLLSTVVANITIASTVATYQQSNSATAPLFTSTSNTVNIQIVARTLSQSDVNINNLIMISIIAIFYSIILVVRIVFNLSKKSKT